MLRNWKYIFFIVSSIKLKWKWIEESPQLKYDHNSFLIWGGIYMLHDYSWQHIWLFTVEHPDVIQRRWRFRGNQWCSFGAVVQDWQWCKFLFCCFHDILRNIYKHFISFKSFDWHTQGISLFNESTSGVLTLHQKVWDLFSSCENHSHGVSWFQHVTVMIPEPLC